MSASWQAPYPGARWASTKHSHSEPKKFKVNEQKESGVPKITSCNIVMKWNYLKSQAITTSECCYQKVQLCTNITLLFLFCINHIIMWIQLQVFPRTFSFLSRKICINIHVHCQSLHDLNICFVLHAMRDKVFYFQHFSHDLQTCQDDKRKFMYLSIPFSCS